MMSWYQAISGPTGRFAFFSNKIVQNFFAHIFRGDILNILPQAE